MVATRRSVERVLLAGAHLKGRASGWAPKDSMDELAQLARSAGAQVVGSVSQRIDRPTHTYLGKGKLDDLRRRAADMDAHTVVCDDELTPTQQRNLENALDGLKVIDRTGLILDVFGRRAQTREGRLQVELAQHEYLLPRLAGQWSHLERLGGGIGTRGPGETQIETDRRLVRERIQRLKKSLDGVRRHRSLYRNRRKAAQMPVVSLVGYTNAGKSTLLNRLTGAGVTAREQLFSTLDPVTRKITLPSGREALLTDTVGFIQKLPPAVVAAFRATLEEVQEADALLHVVDITHRNAPEQVDSVYQILDQLGLASKPQAMVLNKVDRLPVADGEVSPNDLSGIANLPSVSVIVSALTGLGVEDLTAKIEELLGQHRER